MLVRAAVTGLCLWAICAPAHAGDADLHPKHVQSDQIGCASEEMMRDVLRYMTQGDPDAAKRVIHPAAGAGLCRMFLKGELVYVEDRDEGAGLVRLRLKGEPQAFWALAEAVGINDEQ